MVISHSRRVLILCTGNSARSQMAEGLLRELGGGRVEAASAGSEPSRVHPLALRAMAERGVPIDGQRSKHWRELGDREFDHVITVCDQAAESCPVFPGAARRTHWSLPDPAAAEGAEEERYRRFVEVRDDLETRLAAWLRELRELGELEG